MVLRDALMAVVWTTVNLLLARMSWRLSEALSPGRSFVDRLLDALVVGLSTIIAGTILLGTVGWLSGITLLLIVAALAVAGEWLTRGILKQQRTSAPANDSPARPLKNGDWLRRVWTFLTESESPPVPVPRFQPAGSEPHFTPLSEVQLSADRSPTNWFGIVWGMLLAWLVSHMIVDGLLKFPTDWDCLMYHIPMVDEWLQAGSLYAPDSSYWWSPGNSEVIGLWCVAPFSGDFLIALNNLPVMVLWVASTISVARALGISNAGSHFTAIAVVLVHTSFHETDDASNDLLLVAAFTAAVAYLLRNLRQPRTTEVVLGGLSLGLLAGVKYFSVGYVTLVVGAWGIAALLNCVSKKGDSHRLTNEDCGENQVAPEPDPAFQRTASTSLQGKLWSIGCELALLVALAIPCGAYWYVRNVVVSGSPFYPMGLSGESPAVGYPNVGTTSLWGNPDPERWGLVLPSLWKMTGPIHLVAVLALPAVIIGLFADAYWHRPGEVGRYFDRLRWPLLATLAAGTGLLLLFTPFAVEDQPGTLNHLRWAYTPVRYGLPYLSLAVVGLGVVVGRLLQALDNRLFGSLSPTIDGRRRWIRWITLAGIVGLLVSQAVHRFKCGAIELDVVDSLLLAFTLTVLASHRTLLTAHPRLAPLRPAFLLFISTTFAAASVTLLSHRWHSEFDSRYDRFFQTTLFTELARDYRDAGRLCVLDLRHYAFFGSARQRRVCRPRYLGKPEALYFYLRERHVTYVVTHNGWELPFHLYHDVPRWLRSAPALFHRQTTGASHTLYLYTSNEEAFGRTAQE